MAESSDKLLEDAGDLVERAQALQALQKLENQNQIKNAEAEVSSTIAAQQPTLSKDGDAITQLPLSNTLSSEPEAIQVAPAPAKSQDIIAAEKAVTDATAALDALKEKTPDPNATPEAAAAAITEIETAEATLKTAENTLTELNAAAAATAKAVAAPPAAVIGGRRHSKRRHPKKGSRKSKKGGRSRKSKKGGRSRKNGSKHRKHSRAHKKH